MKKKCSDCGIIFECRENSTARLTGKCHTCHTNGFRFIKLQTQINELKIRISKLEDKKITPFERTRKGRKLIIHYDDCGKYACNQAVHPTPSKKTTECMAVTCKNCLKIMGR